MLNELIFFCYLITIAVSCYGALLLGPQALVALMSLLAILANLFVTKEIRLFTLAATSSDALAVGVTLCLNIIQEFHGKALTRKAIWTSLFCLIAYTTFSQLHIWYIPHPADLMHEHFFYILSSMPRITIASFITFFIVQNLDAYLYGFTKKIMPKLSFSLRNILCISITQLVDTLLFSFLGLYGLVRNVGEIILISYAIKLITIFVLIPLTRLLFNLLNVFYFLASKQN